MEKETEGEMNMDNRCQQEPIIWVSVEPGILLQSTQISPTMFPTTASPWQWLVES